MQLTLSFSILLASLAVLFAGVDAAPAPSKRSGMVTLPLKRVPQSSSGLHATVVRPSATILLSNMNS